MAKTTTIRTTFAGGEVAPELGWRPDLQLFQNSLEICENWICKPTGSLRRRPGTEHVLHLVGPDDAAAECVRILPFEFSRSIYRLVALVAADADSDATLRVYNVDPDWAGDREVATFATSYKGAILREIQYIQSADVLFLAHETVPVMRLERRVDTADEQDWRFVEHTFRGGPYQLPDGTIRPGFDAYLEPFIPERGATRGDVVALQVNKNLGITNKDPNNPPDGTWGAGFYIDRPFPDEVGPDDPGRYPHADPDAGNTAVGLMDGGEAGTSFRIARFYETEDEAHLGAPRSRAFFRLKVVRDDVAELEGARCVLMQDHLGEWRPWFVAEVDDAANHVILESNYWKGWNAESPAGEPDDPGTAAAFPAAWTPGRMYLCPARTDSDWFAHLAEVDIPPHDPGDPVADYLDGYLVPTAAYTGQVFARVKDVSVGQLTSALPEGPYPGVPGVLSVEASLAERVFLPVMAGSILRGEYDGFEAIRGMFHIAGVYPAFNTQPIDNKLMWSQIPDGGDYTDNNGWNWRLMDSFAEFAPVSVYGTIRVRTEGGTWSGKLELQTTETLADNDWTTTGVIVSNEDRNAELERDILVTGTYARLVMKDFGEKLTDHGEKTNAGQCRLAFEVLGTVFDEYTMEEEVLEPGAGAILRPPFGLSRRGDVRRHDWREFGPTRGYPAAIAFHEERLWIAGQGMTSNTLFASGIDSFETWGEGTLETSPIRFQISSDAHNAIRWLRSQQQLLIGVDDSEWTFGSRTADKPVSGETVSARRQGSYGSEAFQAVQGSDLIASIQYGRRKIRGLKYSWELEGYDAADLTAFATHLPGAGGFVELAQISTPWTHIFALRADGQVCVLSYDASQELMAWARWTFGDRGESICTSPGGTYGRLLWAAVRRGQFVHLERLDLGGNVHLDCHARYRNVGVGTVFERHLAPQVVSALGWPTAITDRRVLAQGRDHQYIAGEEHRPHDITGWVGWGEWQSLWHFDDVAIGLPYESRARTFPVLLGQEAYGPIVNAHQVDVYLQDSWAVDVSLDRGLEWETARLIPAADMLQLTLKTGIVPIKISSGYNDHLQVDLRARHPWPAEVCGLALAVERTR